MMALGAVNRNTCDGYRAIGDTVANEVAIRPGNGAADPIMALREQ